MINKAEILLPENTYHIYNRANGNEKLFIQSENYRFFLEQYQLYVSPYVDTFSYCLMPNHFHLLLRIKQEKEWPEANLPGLADPERRQNLEGLPQASQHLSLQFSRFFNSYTKAFNKTYNRKGSLFMKNFKRILVKDDRYLKKLVHYIHHNPVEAGLCNVVHEWPWSSYSPLIENKRSFLKSAEVITWFDDINNFKSFHKRSPILEETD
jgi:putative transposase